MNVPIIFWIGLAGGLGIGFVMGARVGHEKGLSRDVQLLKKTLKLTPVLKQ